MFLEQNQEGQSSDKEINMVKKRREEEVRGTGNSSLPAFLRKLEVVSIVVDSYQWISIKRVMKLTCIF